MSSQTSPFFFSFLPVFQLRKKGGVEGFITLYSFLIGLPLSGTTCAISFSHLHVISKPSMVDVILSCLENLLNGQNTHIYDLQVGELRSKNEYCYKGAKSRAFQRLAHLVPCIHTRFAVERTFFETLTCSARFIYRSRNGTPLTQHHRDP